MLILLYMFQQTDLKWIFSFYKLSYIVFESIDEIWAKPMLRFVYILLRISDNIIGLKI